jgi:hypothetical protein
MYNIKHGRRYQHKQCIETVLVNLMSWNRTIKPTGILHKSENDPSLSRLVLAAIEEHKVTMLLNLDITYANEKNRNV